MVRQTAPLDSDLYYKSHIWAKFSEDFKLFGRPGLNFE